MQANLLTNVILPLALATIMLGMGLSLQPEDFRRVRKYPKAISVGLYQFKKRMQHIGRGLVFALTLRIIYM